VVRRVAVGHRDAWVVRPDASADAALAENRDAERLGRRVMPLQDACQAAERPVASEVEVLPDRLVLQVASQVVLPGAWPGEQ
jgi:hypothetical protein